MKNKPNWETIKQHEVTIEDESRFDLSKSIAQNCTDDIEIAEGAVSVTQDSASGDAYVAYFENEVITDDCYIRTETLREILPELPRY